MTPDQAAVVILILVLGFVLPVILGAVFGSFRGRPGAGMLLGLCLSWLGVLMALFLPAPRRRYRRR
jgi:hypothetical protein